ncbi:peptidase domain-containing ABC transporter [Nocardioides marmorisolisilvae]|uniref:ATP-binding cassette domain-containing protein n=1 Tax=Nocardioides marmorisolisilvae TaxID=1542737 RepID=A0A3N0DT30_9ACTN|nr:peptidase domain-containing ABC transporter [Nocardioides marmorisolisilvae]RNL78772.1 ATP-binding cassette domain-containing protein [Nocardioides marmorisolisilvae]
MKDDLPGDALALADAPLQLRLMVQACLEETVHDFGAELATQGEQPTEVHVIAQGRARCTVRGTDGVEVQVGVLGPGEVVAAEAAFDTASPVTVRASGPLSTVRLHGTVARAAAELWEPAAAALQQVVVDRARDVASGISEPIGRRSTRAADAQHARDLIEADERSPEPPAGASADWERFRTRRRRPKVPVVFGVDEMDCGPAALTGVSRAFGHPISFAAVREAVSTASDGTSLLGLYQGATELGLDAQMTTVSASRLDELPLPAICHVHGNHWVVLEKVGRREVRVMDPLGASGAWPRAGFEETFSGFALLVAPTEKLKQAPTTASGSGFFRPFLRAEIPAIVLAFVFGIAIAAANLAVPLSSEWVIKEVITKNDTGSLLPVVLLVLGVLALAMVLTVTQRYVITRAALRIDRASLDHVAGTLLGLPAHYFHTRRTGDIERRLNGLREVRSFFLTRGVGAFVSIFQVVGALIIIGRWDLQLTLLYAAVLPLYLVLMVVSRSKLRPAFQSLEESWGRYKSRQIDTIRGIDTVKAAGAEQQVRSGLDRQFGDLADRLFSADLTIMLYEGALSVVSLLPLALGITFGSYEVVHGDLGFPQYVSFLSLVMLTSPQLTQLFALWDVVQQARVLLDRLTEFVDQPPEQLEGDGIPPGRITGHVRLDQVTFRHPGSGDQPVLTDVSVQATPGQTIAIVGRSGAGKSTLLNLLTSMIQPESGTITCDGIDLAEIDRRAYRRQLGVVLQDSHLFDGTIAENIALGEDRIDLERIVRAAQVATADDFVRRLPLGYDTRVGERGIRLSGGERQRICVARALYRDPVLLLLDEATSALDAESEFALQTSLRTALADRTVFVVAHRLSTVRDADEILVLEAGRVVERGTHHDLLERRGIYYELAANQLS